MEICSVERWFQENFLFICANILELTISSVYKIRVYANNRALSSVKLYKLSESYEPPRAPPLSWAFMTYDNGHIHGFIRSHAASDASFSAAPETCGRLEDAVPDFETELKARYERLSLLTLDLAEEAGEAARGAKAHKTKNHYFSQVDNNTARSGRFEQRIAAMIRAIWAHRVIERLRTGKGSGRLWPQHTCGGATTKRRTDVARHSADNSVSRGGFNMGGFHPLYDDVVEQNVPRETPSEQSCVRTIAEGKDGPTFEKDSIVGADQSDHNERRGLYDLENTEQRSVDDFHAPGKHRPVIDQNPERDEVGCRSREAAIILRVSSATAAHNPRDGPHTKRLPCEHEKETSRLSKSCQSHSHRLNKDAEVKRERPSHAA